MTSPSPLKQHLIRLIQSQGPLPLSVYMAEALGHPDYGYYRTHDPLGRTGDFTTAPEISQMFGELVGLWLGNVWQLMDCPTPVHFVELGPGRGTLMADAVRVLKLLPALKENLTVHFVETSPALRQKQKMALAGEDINIVWHDHFHSVTELVGTAPLFMIANEFFDALPIQQFILQDDGWHERLVTLNKDQDQLVPGLTPGPSPAAALIPQRVKEQARIGDIAEACPIGIAIIRDIADHLKNYGGVALIIDYGHLQSGAGDTFQAVKDHEYTDPFAEPGAADLTAHVDFETLSLVASESGAHCYAPLTQGEFLSRLGIAARAAQLTAAAHGKKAKAIETEMARLIAPDQMGTLFKVLALSGTTLSSVPGFES